MKRPIKPFVVEVRKGSKNPNKKTPVTDLLPLDLLEEKPRENGVLKRAEAALFKAAPKAEESGAANRSGRILESIAVGEQKAEEPPIEIKRRGRPPGSPNKPKELQADRPETTEVPKRRGRPPKIVEGSVRKVQLTPELASAALESIAKAGVTRPAPPIISTQKAPKALPRVKPTRAPRAAQPALKAVKKKTRALAASPQSAPEQSPAPPPAPAAMRPSSPLDRLPRMLAMATEMGRNDPEGLFAALQRPRAGQRWRRRLRGAAFFAHERRQRKSIPTPR